MYVYKIRKVLKVYDGDTITVEIDLGFGVYKTEKIRLAGINAPEIRGEERVAGLSSRDFLREILYTAEKNGDEITIKTIKDRKGKYGRYLGYIFINGKNINDRMVKEGYAVLYGG